jgi:DNA-binding PadR family transcriptional regulator
MAKTATTQFAILGILMLGPSSGYEIAKFCREVLNSFWSESYGQIYPRLKQLVEQGLVKKKELPGSNRRKAIYTITAKGRKAVAAWAAQPSAPQPVRNEMLLKVFFGAELPLETSRQQIAQFLDGQEHALGFLKSVEKELASVELTERQRVHWHMTIRMGIHVIRARIKWAKESLVELERFESSS